MSFIMFEKYNQELFYFEILVIGVFSMDTGTTLRLERMGPCFIVGIRGATRWVRGPVVLHSSCMLG